MIDAKRGEKEAWLGVFPWFQDESHTYGDREAPNGSTVLCNEDRRFLRVKGRLDSTLDARVQHVVAAVESVELMMCTKKRDSDRHVPQLADAEDLPAGAV